MMTFWLWPFLGGLALGAMGMFALLAFLLRGNY